MHHFSVRLQFSFVDVLDNIAIMFVVLVCAMVSISWIAGRYHNTLLSEEAPDPIRLVLIAYSWAIVLYRWGYQIGVSPVFTTVGFLIFAITSFTRNLKVGHLSKKSDFIRKNYWYVTLTSVILIPLFPLIKSKALFYSHSGPDLTGHMLSAASMRAGETYSDALQSLSETSGSAQWWSLKNVGWVATDFRDAISIEFLLRCSRYGHGAITTFVSVSTGLDVPESLLVAISAALLLATAVLVRNFLKTGVSSAVAVLLSLLVVFAPSYIFMVHEGVIAQIFALPLVFFAVSESPRLFEQSLSNLHKFQFALIFSALIGTMTEAAQLVAGYLTVLVVAKFLHPTLRASVQQLLSNGTKIFVLMVMISPFAIVEFVLNFVLRFQQRFFYTGFGLVGWDPISILLPLPIFRALDHEYSVSIVASHFSEFLEIGILIAISFLIWYRKREQASLSSFAIANLMFIVAITGGGYPLWKLCIFFQPVLIEGLILPFVKKRNERRVESGLRMALLVVSFSGIVLLNQYDQNSTKLYADQFRVREGATNLANKVLVTPTTTDVYFNLGATGPFVYANSGWSPVFDNSKQNWEIMLYFACPIEGEARCKKINTASNGAIQEYVLYPTGVPIKFLLESDGRINRAKLKTFIQTKFGVGESGSLE